MVTELEAGLGLPKWGPVCRPQSPFWLQTVEPRNAIPLGPSTAWTGGGAGSNEQELLSPGSEPHSSPISHTAENPVSSKERHAPPAPHPTSGPYCSQTTPEKSLFPFSRLLMRRIKRKPQSGVQSPQTQEIRLWASPQPLFPTKPLSQLAKYTDTQRWGQRCLVQCSF